MDTLFTTCAELHEIGRALEKARSTSATVKVSKAALDHLYRDHHKLFRLCKGRIAEPKE